MIIIHCSNSKLREKLLQNSAYLTLENAVEYARIDEETEKNAETVTSKRSS